MNKKKNLNEDCFFCGMWILKDPVENFEKNLDLFGSQLVIGYIYQYDKMLLN